MAYKLIVTDRADELIDNLTGYLLYRLNNTDAAIRFLNELGKVYNRLNENPFQFSECSDIYLSRKGYRDALLTGMNYRVVYRVEDDFVYIVGVFHVREDYGKKVIPSS